VRVRELTRELFRDQGPIPPTRRFEWTVVVLCTWLMAGAYLDAWAHRHLARLETFFTPWHAILYSFWAPARCATRPTGTASIKPCPRAITSR